MTNKNFTHRAEVVGETLNGNADFWSAHPAADLIGGQVQDIEKGMVIVDGRVYNFENHSLDDVHIWVERSPNEASEPFRITVREAETHEEILYDEADTLTEAFEILASWAPAPLFQSIWDASKLAPLGDASEIFYNGMVITNFRWIDHAMKIDSVGQLAIYAYRTPMEDLTADGPEYFYSLYHTAPGVVNADDVKFDSVLELIEYVKNHSELTSSSAKI